MDAWREARQERKTGNLEVTIGITNIVGTVVFAWAARPSATGAARRIAAHPRLGPHCPVILMMLLLTGAILIALGSACKSGQVEA
jgi:hypothetical protein